MKKQTKLKVVNHEHRQQTEVRPSILNKDFKYHCAADTDVQRTWKRFGWTSMEKRSESNT